jgi:periplasmic protein CpxP/Spy
MNITQKTLAALLGIGFAALLSNSVLANEQYSSKDECHHSWSNEQRDGYGAHFDKRMSALHDNLKLTSSQEASWTEFSNKMKPVKMDKPGQQDWKDLSTPDRFDRMLDNMKSREKKMTEHAAAVRAFYDTLTKEQKKIFDRHFQPHHRHHHQRHYDHKHAYDEK